VTPPFRFAVQVDKADSAGAWRELARQAEDLGYSTLFVADHYMGPGPAAKAAGAPIQHIAPIAALATAAAVTSTLRVGTRVFCVDYHVPAVLVKEAATIDLLSSGRLEFGIGAGWSKGEYEAMGLTFGPAPQRVAKLREVVALFKAHCSGDEMAQRGDYATAVGYTGLPSPVQKPHPPIMVGGGRRQVLTFAAQQADIVSINNVHFSERNDAGLTPQEEMQRRMEWVRDGAGDRLSSLDIEVSPYLISITEDPERSAEKLGAAVGVRPDLLPDHPNVLIGSLEQMADRLEQRREHYGVNYITVQQSRLEAFAPVVARLAGR
jgi:probable F420-dependent oxidoreductase